MSSDPAIARARALLVELGTASPGNASQEQIDAALAGLDDVERRQAAYLATERRLADMVECLYAFAALDFSHVLHLDHDGSIVDAISGSINMLGEELLTYREQRERVERDLEARIAERTHQLVHAEKLALAGQLASSVAHEINNPLTYVRGNLGALVDYAAAIRELWSAARSTAVWLRRKGGVEGAAYARRLVGAAGSETATEAMVADVGVVVADVTEGIQRMADLVTDFNHLSVDPVERSAELIDVAEVVKECVAALPPSMAGRVELAGPVDPLVACAARADVRAGVLSLLRFLVGPERARPDAGPVSIRLTRSGGRACLTVADPTLELTEIERGRLFDPRLEVDTTQGRTMRLNISLSVGYQTLRRNGAEIGIARHPAGGSTFRITFAA